MPFHDRADAGRRLGSALLALGLVDPVVVGMARGGVAVAAAVARALGAPLDVVVVRKLGHPGQPELGLGAIGEDGVRVINGTLVTQMGVPDDALEQIAAREGVELARRLRVYRQGRPPVPVQGRTVVVVDDGLATGSTAFAALEVLRARGAARLVLAVPVAPPAVIARLAPVADDVVCLERTEHFSGLSQWYSDFHQVTDDEVRTMLEGVTTDVRSIPAGGHALAAELSVPSRPRGVVIFAHGSGSSRLSPRNRAVASVLHDRGLATVLFDLLTEQEAADRSSVFDVPELATRLVAARHWVRTQPELQEPAEPAEPAELPVGFFGASTGAAAALVAAAELGTTVAAVVCRGGRPDLAGEAALAHVVAPTLLVVGEADTDVLALNREALGLLRCERRLDVVAGATHLFEEPGALDQMAGLAAGWFTSHMASPWRRPGAES